MDEIVCYICQKKALPTTSSVGPWTKTGYPGNWMNLIRADKSIVHVCSEPCRTAYENIGNLLLKVFLN